MCVPQIFNLHVVKILFVIFPLFILIIRYKNTQLINEIYFKYYKLIFHPSPNAEPTAKDRLNVRVIKLIIWGVFK